MAKSKETHNANARAAACGNTKRKKRIRNGPSCREKCLHNPVRMVANWYPHDHKKE